MKLAIIGAGIMGANHARLSRAIRDAEVAYVVDPDLERAGLLADSVGATPTRELGDVLGSVDAAVVAAPNELHLPIGLELIKAGLHLLVEKPLAPNATDAARLVEAADRSGVTLMPGHVERFNPAVMELGHLLDSVVHIAADRISPFQTRIAEGVIADLMIHDLDIVRSIAGCEPTHVEAVARAVRSESDDLASALLVFENGMTASLTASRIGQQKIRELRITQRDSFVTVDLVRQDVTINRVEHSEFLSDEGARYRQSGVVEIPFLEQRGEPLALELAEFVRSVSTGTTPAVTGHDGLAAVQLTELVADVARRS